MKTQSRWLLLLVVAAFGGFVGWLFRRHMGLAGGLASGVGFAVAYTVFAVITRSRPWPSDNARRLQHWVGFCLASIAVICATILFLCGDASDALMAVICAVMLLVAVIGDLIWLIHRDPKSRGQFDDCNLK